MRRDPRDILQHPVALGVTLRVVDLLEMVDVEDHERERLAGRTLPREHRVEMLVERPPVRQTGQGIAAAELCSPHHGLDARLELVLLEGLAEVVVRARAQAAHAIDVLGARRQHDHGHAVGLPDAVERLPAVDARHDDVEQHDVGPELAEDAQAVEPVDGNRDLESALLETVRDHRPLRGAVVDEQHGDRAHGRPSWIATSRASHASITVAASIGPARRSPGAGRTPSMRRACS